MTIEYPPYIPKIKQQDGKEIIFDEIRKQWVLLTPEEWVRQNFMQYLVQVKKYPAALIAVEKQLQLHDVKKRFDILVYDANSRPWLMVECKAMDVPLNQPVLNQILQYNMVLQVSYLVVTNGSYCRAFFIGNQQLEEVAALPT